MCLLVIIVNYTTAIIFCPINFGEVLWEISNIRINYLSAGEYGLSQAVQEIKDLKANLRIRDEKIEGLTRQVNELGIEVNDAETENEELRERLGLNPKEPLDTETIKEKKMIKNQQQAALNRVLSKEVLDIRLCNSLILNSFTLVSYSEVSFRNHCYF